MIDFLMISTRSTKRGVIEIYPKFIIKKSSDLMIRGGDFYAIWIEERGLWSTDEHDALQLIDNELRKYAEENKSKFDSAIKILYMWDAESGMIDKWHKYCQKQMRDHFHVLDEQIIFSDSKTVKTDYASKKLPYPLKKGDISSYDKLMTTLYSKEERKKIEWAIGSIVEGDSKKIQKFLVLYGAAGTGKSTVLNIIQQLFEGYYSVFDAKALGSSSNSFALEAFKSNPLVAIQHDGDLSKIEDNTRLNSLVAHEYMTVNEKFKSTYTNRFQCFLFMGTNKPVKITDGKSGLLRRLIDVSPSGNKLGIGEYKAIMKRITFELGAIAYHCKKVYLKNKDYYDDYIPTAMLGASNDFYNFILDSYHVFKKDDGTTLKAAWEMYRVYCEEAKVLYSNSQRVFKEELKNYFWEYKDRAVTEDGARVRSYYEGFRTDKFKNLEEENDIYSEPEISLKEIESIFDIFCKDCIAQYTTKDETPLKKWAEVTTTLKDIKTSKLHYVKTDENHIVIDFDILDENGEKSLELSIKEASKWPPTYAEVSKSGKALHLHYIYVGDVEQLEDLYSENIEIKKFTGGRALRRRLTKCNDLEIATISSGLPLKGEKKMAVNVEAVKSEKKLRELIKRNLNKEIHASTKPSIDFIFKILNDAYKDGLKYDISDMRNSILAFAANSTNKADYCVKLVSQMKFKSDDPSDNVRNDFEPLIFYDIEVFPNLFLVCWKKQGENQPFVIMMNPQPHEIEELIKYRLIGFNCRRYDNHLIYARLIGYSTEQIYQLSQKIINGEPGGYFGEAYNISYTDVYDFSSKKQGLKKFQIELGIRHKELGYAWDEPVPEDKWQEVADYCCNDVLATEAVFEDRQPDFLARKILSDLAGMTVNDTTNTLTTRIIFGNERKPQSVFNYRDLSGGEMIFKDLFHSEVSPGEYNVFDHFGRPVFPGYIFENGKSIYRGEEVGEGGYVHSEPGMYGNVAVLDIASMHPSTIVAENLFGNEYTQRFKDILDARLAIKHGEFDSAKKMLGGKLKRYLDNEAMADDLSTALKIAVNSVYGLTAANFDNPFRDIRNTDNIVAKRGALFMVNLKHEVMKKGFKVAHIKTDSIKIPDATQEIIDFVIGFGREYGYSFEHECTFDRMCLVNNAVYIARYPNGEWTATGTQFSVPYVFKTLFSKEEIVFDDLCETKNVTTALYLDMNENLPEDEHNYIFVGKAGRFCPIKEGKGGGLLLRESTKKKEDGEKSFGFATGSKGYRWLESEMVLELKKEADIDISYYEKMVETAKKDIEAQGEFEWFVSEDKYDKYNNGIWPF